MAGAVLVITHIVVDTSYWLEFFQVPSRWSEVNFKEIRNKFQSAIKNKHRLYIPIPVLFELANHIAHVENGYKREQLTHKFSETVKRGIDIKEPIINIIPCSAFSVANELNQNLEYFVNRFESEFAQQGLGFTDSAIILEAENIKNDRNYVHIWTLDSRDSKNLKNRGLNLKAREPDPEPNPFAS
ncbi:MAG: hypothetical protein GQ569_00845 [Methylococcaceae bacterium]|nr:hypothetical protein [Methylococcaceae bacterium]